MGNPEGKSPLGRRRRRWVNNIRMGIQEVGCVYVKVVTDNSQIFFLRRQALQPFIVVGV